MLRAPRSRAEPLSNRERGRDGDPGRALRVRPRALRVLRERRRRLSAHATRRPAPHPASIVVDVRARDGTRRARPLRVRPRGLPRSRPLLPGRSGRGRRGQPPLPRWGHAPGGPRRTVHRRPARARRALAGAQRPDPSSGSSGRALRRHLAGRRARWSRPPDPRHPGVQPEHGRRAPRLLGLERSLDARPPRPRRASAAMGSPHYPGSALAECGRRPPTLLGSRRSRRR